MTTTDTCWADPLSRAERRILAAKLARAAKRLYWTRYPVGIFAASGIRASIECRDLRLDVTERAAVAA